MENRFRKIRCVFIPVAFILIYYLSLRFVFPGYFKPFIPHHSDILDYPYDLSGNGISILKARPIGLILTWFFGVFCSWKGIIVSAAVAIFFSLMLVSEIISRETKNTISTWNLMLYMVLVLIAPTFYLNYSFDIYGTYAQLIGLFAVRLTYCEELSRKPIVRGTLFFSVMLMSFLSKETYIVSFCFFYFAKAIIDHTERRWSLILLTLTALAGIVSLLYGKILGSTFVSSSLNESSPYLVNVSLTSLVKCFLYYAKGLWNIPFLAVLFIGALSAFRSKDKGAITASMFCISGVFAYAPYAVLPNKLVPHYVFVALPMLAGMVLLIRLPSAWQKKGLDRLFGTLFCAAVIFSYSKMNPAYSYQAMSGWIATEKGMEQSISSLDLVCDVVQPDDNVLVLGLEKYTENFYRASFAVEKYLPDNVHFDVYNVHPEFCGDISPKVTYISYYNNSDLNQYDKVLVYSEQGVRVLSCGSEEFEQYRTGESRSLVIHDTDVYPGTVISRSGKDENGGIAIAISLTDIQNSMKIVVDEVAMDTCHGADFISTMLTSEFLEKDVVEIRVMDTADGALSNAVMIQICD